MLCTHERHRAYPCAWDRTQGYRATLARRGADRTGQASFLHWVALLCVLALLICPTRHQLVAPGHVGRQAGMYMPGQASIHISCATHIASITKMDVAPCRNFIGPVFLLFRFHSGIHPSIRWHRSQPPASPLGGQVHVQYIHVIRIRFPPEEKKKSKCSPSQLISSSRPRLCVMGLGALVPFSRIQEPVYEL